MRKSIKMFMGLIAVLAMLSVAGPALANGFVTLEGQASAWTEYHVGNQTGAGGWSGSEGHYSAVAWGGGYGDAEANSITIAGRCGGPNWRAAASFTHSDSSAYTGANGYTGAGVSGAGLAYHGTSLSGPTGGSTYGVATYSYGAENSSAYYSEAEGSGMAGTGGVTWRTQHSNGVASHARSFSFAVAGASSSGAL